MFMAYKEEREKKEREKERKKKQNQCDIVSFHQKVQSVGNFVFGISIK
jgi:hypothetical protein